MSDKTKMLFEKIRKNIFNLDERIQEKPVSWYIGYRIRYFNFCSISPAKNYLRVYVRKQKIDDPKNLFKKVPAKWGWGKTPLWFGDLNKEDNLDYFLGIIKQAYQSAPDL